MDETNWPTGWTRAALELCVLACVAELGTTHGYQVARRLADAGLGEVKGGTLYPVLTRLEEQGLTTTRWVEGHGGPGRKLVQVSDAGRSALDERRQQWARWTTRVAELLDTATSTSPTRHLEETR
jgi:PadR family transcriptional regulator PadR